MAIYAAVFSPTGTSRRGAWAMASALGKATLLDVTCSSPSPQTFGPEDLVIFGAPVYGGRVFQGALERLAPLKGNQTPCIVTVTYGNRDFDDALLELTEFCKAQGFLPFAGAALVENIPTAPSKWGAPWKRISSRTGLLPWKPGMISPPGGRTLLPPATILTRKGAREAALFPPPGTPAPTAVFAGGNVPWEPSGRIASPWIRTSASPVSGASNPAPFRPRDALPRNTKASPPLFRSG